MSMQKAELRQLRIIVSNDKKVKLISK